MLLHGEEEVECIESLIPGERYKVEGRVVDIVDKGKLSIVAVKKEISGQDGKIRTRIITRYVLRGIKAEGHKGGLIPPMQLP